MRKLNLRICTAMVFLLLLHCALGCFMLSGISRIYFRLLNVLLACCVCLHAVLGCLVCFRSIRNALRTGTWYLRENWRHWTQIVSGFGIIILLPFHVSAYTTSSGGKYFLREFTCTGLILQILFASAVYIHVLLGIGSLSVACAWLDSRPMRTVCRTVCTCLYLLALFSLLVYYRRWTA